MERAGNELSKPQWISMLTKSWPLFPKADCLRICRSDFLKSLTKLFKAATFQQSTDQNVDEADASLNHVLSYGNIREFICNKLDDYYQVFQNNPVQANLHLDAISELITLLFTPDGNAMVNYQYDIEVQNGINVLVWVSNTLPLSVNYEILHTGNLYKQ